MTVLMGNWVMKEVSVIGLGSMGSALAKCLLKSGYNVTVWNRSADKANSLVAAGARLASSPEVAIKASPITITCIKNHSETLSLLKPTAAAINGRVICDLSTGDSSDADKLVEFLRKNGADYMVGIINAYPSGIGLRETALLTAAEKKTWEEHRDIIQSLGGSSAHIGTEPAALAALFAGLFTARQGWMFGMIYGALVCQKAGVSLKVFSDQLPVSMGMNQNYYRTFSKTVPEGKYDDAEATMATYAAALDDALNSFKAHGARADLPQLFSDQVHAAMEAGMADKQMTALVAHLSAN
jgi:3-hydroxyisobutyrate dehydrogenase-like beta-hydroxyacid dehydrogenase